jgi:protein-L-isoaspartate(D-aspartate) O-methyltransferase
MIEQQIRPWDVLDARVLELLAVVRREDFVPPAYRGLAFADIELPLGGSGAAASAAAGKVMLPPRVEARMLQDLDIAKHERVLEIGAGSGFMAALLGHRAQRVLTLEIDDDLARAARANLQRAGLLNVEVRMADGASAFLGDDGPFDAIVLSGSVAQLPEHLMSLLKPGGRLLAIVGEEPVMRATLVRHTDNGHVITQPWDAGAPRLLNFPEPPRFHF